MQIYYYLVALQCTEKCCDALTFRYWKMSILVWLSEECCEWNFRNISFLSLKQYCENEILDSCLSYPRTEEWLSSNWLKEYFPSQSMNQTVRSVREKLNKVIHFNYYIFLQDRLYKFWTLNHFLFIVDSIK